MFVLYLVKLLNEQSIQNSYSKVVCQCQYNVLTHECAEQERQQNALRLPMLDLVMPSCPYSIGQDNFTTNLLSRKMFISYLSMAHLIYYIYYILLPNGNHEKLGLYLWISFLQRNPVLAYIGNQLFYMVSLKSKIQHVTQITNFSKCSIDKNINYSKLCACIHQTLHANIAKKEPLYVKKTSQNI